MDFGFEFDYLYYIHLKKFKLIFFKYENLFI